MQTAIRPLPLVDHAEAIRIINEAAGWYRDFLPPEELHGPEMTPDSFAGEAARMAWYGAYRDDRLVGVMGVEYVGDAALLRHAYVLPAHQRDGVGLALARHGEAEVRRSARPIELIIVGTYADNPKARGALERLGYSLSPDSESVLRAYFEIPEDRLLGSVTYEKRIN